MGGLPPPKKIIINQSWGEGGGEEKGGVCFFFSINKNYFDIKNGVGKSVWIQSIGVGSMTLHE